MTLPDTWTGLLAMRHDEQVRRITQMCAHLDAGTNVDSRGLPRLPTTDYSDSARPAQEWRDNFVGMPQTPT